MQRNIHTVLVTSLIAGTFCQKIVLDNTTFITPCTTGARSGVDRYFIAGTIGDNITEALNQHWLPAVLLQVLKKSSSNFVPLCSFVINGTVCDPSPGANCTCVYNTTTDRVHFTANYTIQADDNNAVIRAEWQHGNGPIIYSDRNYNLREIYDVNAGQLTLTVAGVTGNPPSGSCSFNLTLHKSSDLELCCSNTAKPCYPQIAFSGTVVANKTCVTYPTSQLPSDVVTGNLELSYSMCTQTGYIPGNTCSVTITNKPSDDKDKITVLVVIALVVLVIIVGVAVAVYYYKIKKRSKAVSDHERNESAGSEHYKTDRHNAEHRNQAYDGRRSSPSEVTIDDVKTTKYENTQQRNTAHEKDNNKPISDRTNDDNASQSVPGNPRQLPPLKGTHTHGQLHPPAVSRPASVEITSTHQL